MRVIRLVLCLLVLLVLLAAVARAQAPQPKFCRLHINSDPPGADIIWEGNFIGHTDTDINVDLAKLWAVRAPTYNVVLRMEGYHDLPLAIPLAEAYNRPTYTFQTVYHLEAKNVLVTANRLVRDHPVVSAMTLLFAMGAGFWLRQRQQSIQAVLARSKRLDALEASKNAMDALIMTKIGGYRLVSLLGKGGMATVYKALPEGDLDPTKAVAIKIIDAETSADPTFQARFKKEVQAGRALIHPAIIRMLEAGQENGLLYLVMEVVDGELLRRKLRPEIPYAELTTMLQPIFEGLSYAHKMGIIHRDLKPENIMVTKDNRIKIMDFGLARHQQSTVTVGSQIMGTPSYMSPEQIEGMACDSRTDQYSLGVLIYEYVTCVRPFDGEYLETIIHRHLSQMPDAMSLHRADVPEALNAAVMRMLAKTPNERFPSLDDAWAALSAAFSSVSL